MSQVLQELLKASKSKDQKQGEATSTFLLRLLTATSKLSDEKFDLLSEDAQRWILNGNKAVKKGLAIPEIPDGTGSDLSKVITAVSFHFLRRGEDDTFLGQVRFPDDGGMILSISGGACPYLLKGIKKNGCFEGVNSAACGWAVHATWTSLGDIYVGVWYEDGDKYLFEFDLL